MSEVGIKKRLHSSAPPIRPHPLLLLLVVPSLFVASFFHLVDCGVRVCESMGDQDLRKRKGAAGADSSSSAAASNVKKGPSPSSSSPPTKGSFCSCSTLFRLVL